ncbi:hypothetical protein ASPCADRAFT_509341 [Aspergillus carbonarius ITEM 5010]|uniref:Uncharacterized protein n=1 Tax=Aspergillus carbonarius (strain ITEM 5010) TaxID=602072 RepID=A0A1R3RCU6_ASPC5|nr:hypothetical protein ASPCADRAFT_133323 [Aspergillus carbonarius ITEM 5010]OOF92336.1 hypothetical protein ASPCADRAFT_509341 [Aspergillus carbonarius ITEM 5010]
MTNIVDPIDDPSYNVEAPEHTFGTSASDSHRNINSYNSENKTGSNSYGNPGNGSHPSSIADTVDRGIGDDGHGRTSDISPTSSYSQDPINKGHGQAPHDKGAQYAQRFSPSYESQHGVSSSVDSSHGTKEPVSTMAAESQPSHANDKTGARIGGGRGDRPDANKEKEGPIEGAQDSDVTGEKVNGIAGVIPISGSAGPTTTKTFDPHAEIGNSGNNGPHSSAAASKNNVGGNQDAPARRYDTASSSYNTLGSDDGQTTTVGKNSRAGSGLAGARAVESRRDI